MASETMHVVFVDLALAVFHEASLALLPKVGDSVDLPDQQIDGVNDGIT